LFSIQAAVIGAIVGASEGKNKIILIEGRSDKEIKEILDKFRKKARVPDYQ